MSESDLWTKLKNGMGDRWDAQRHEDKFQLGIPDVSFGLPGVNGWIELKFLKEYPKRRDSVIRIEHYTENQRQWLYRRWKMAGHVFLLIQISNEFFLFTGQEMALLGNVGNREWYIDRALWYWKKKINFDQLTQLLLEG